jgi:hypothetical protein
VLWQTKVGKPEDRTKFSRLRSQAVTGPPGDSS